MNTIWRNRTAFVLWMGLLGFSVNYLALTPNNTYQNEDFTISSGENLEFLIENTVKPLNSSTLRDFGVICKTECDLQLEFKDQTIYSEVISHHMKIIHIPNLMNIGSLNGYQ